MKISTEKRKKRRKYLQLLGIIALMAVFWAPQAGLAQTETQKGEEQLRRATQRVQEVLQKRYEAACKALGARYVAGIDGPRCLFPMDPEKVCAKLRGRWDGNKCVFEAMCPQVNP